MAQPPIRRIVSFVVLLNSLAFSQSTDPGQPAPSNASGKQYPRIHSDGRVTFRIKLPQAKNVAVAGRGADSGMNGNKPFPMTRSEDGTWSVTTTPVRPGFHYYELIVDGVKMPDPSSETFFGWAQQTSDLEVRQAYVHTPPVVMEKGYAAGTGTNYNQAFRSLVVNDLVPEIDRNFRTMRTARIGP